MKGCIAASVVFLMSLTSPSLAQGGLWDRAKDASTRIELPKLDDLAGDMTEKAIKIASDSMTKVATGFSEIKPKLELLGYHISNAQFEMIPPTARWCIVSTSGGLDMNFDDIKDDGSFTNSVLYAAISAKNVQKVLGFHTVVVNIEFGKSSNVYISYYSQAESSEIASLANDYNRMICSHSLLKSELTR